MCHRPLPQRHSFSDFFSEGSGRLYTGYLKRIIPSSNCPSKLIDIKVRRIVHSKLKLFHFQIKKYYLSDENHQTDNPSHKNTGCPKSSFLYFISLYFSTIGLGKQIFSTKVVSFNIIHYFHTCCAIFWLKYSICVLPRQRCACTNIFSSHMFFEFHSPNCSNSFLVFVNITKDKPP